MLRRAQSSNNLEGLAFSTSFFDVQDLYNSGKLISGSLHKHKILMFHPEPSFSIYSTDDAFHDEEENEELIKEKLMKNEKLTKSVTTGQSIEAQFSFGRNAMRMIKEDDNEHEIKEGEKGSWSNRLKDLQNEILGKFNSSPVYQGHEIGDGGFESKPLMSDDGGDLDENPSHPLFLKNYAQFLESKGDFFRAEENYFRATLVDPQDGEILSRYAKLFWKLHSDKVRASTYFERAACSAPEDSQVLAAYASFLWEVDEKGGEEEEDELSNAEVDKSASQVDHLATDFKDVKRPSSHPLHLATGLGMDMAGFGGCNNAVDESIAVEEYYRSMVDENPCNPLLLSNYAQFLHQSKGDLSGAEEYYSRAIAADPSDGQMISFYANLVWQLHRDRDKAVGYFDRAVQATPEDSHVLASYAKFLWEAEDGEEDDFIEEDCVKTK